jgi:hypothetical protein
MPVENQREIMSWGTALAWGTIIVAVLFAALLAAYLAILHFLPL